MKTQNDKLKFVTEAAGEDWHEIVDKGTGLVFGPGYVPPTCSCGGNPSTMSRNHDNPSPDDIGKLMELAEKLLVKKHYAVKIDFSPDADGNFLYHVRLINIHEHTIQESAETLAEALLNALFVAKGGLEDE